MSHLLVGCLCTLLAFHLVIAKRDCLYEFTSQPRFQFSCDPYNSLLQLHCSVTGPLNPPFQIQWYLGSPSAPDPIRLVDSTTHEISNEVLNTVGDVPDQLKSISSWLSFTPILQVHANRCLWCQVEFDDTDISLARDNYGVCLDTEESYSSLPSCGESLTASNISFCATSEDLEVTTSSTPALPSAPVSPTTEATVFTFPSEETSSIHPLLPQPTDLPITPQMPSPGDPNLLASAAGTTSSPQTTASSTEDQGSAVEAGLVVATVICVVFIVAIIILMYFVVRLFRQWKWKREKERESGEDASTSGNTAVPTSATSLGGGYNVERFHIDSESLFLSTLDDDIDGILTTRSLQDLSHHQQPPVPPLPPKPWKKTMTKSSSASVINFRTLSHGYNNFTFPEVETHQNKDSGLSSVPPPIPVRSKSREHFYHTLECNNDDSGLGLSSPVYSLGSQHSSPALQDTSLEESQQVRKLFDDPRYVALLVEGEEELGTGDLRERKEIWRSTPALASNRLTGRGSDDRRSLRVSQVVGTQIYN